MLSKNWAKFDFRQISNNFYHTISFIIPFHDGMIEVSEVIGSSFPLLLYLVNISSFYHSQRSETPSYRIVYINISLNTFYHSEWSNNTIVDNPIFCTFVFALQKISFCQIAWLDYLKSFKWNWSVEDSLRFIIYQSSFGIMIFLIFQSNWEVKYLSLIVNEKWNILITWCVIM